LLGLRSPLSALCDLVWHVNGRKKRKGKKRKKGGVNLRLRKWHPFFALAHQKGEKEKRGGKRRSRGCSRVNCPAGPKSRRDEGGREGKKKEGKEKKNALFHHLGNSVRTRDLSPREPRSRYRQGRNRKKKRKEGKKKEKERCTNNLIFRDGKSLCGRARRPCAEARKERGEGKKEAKGGNVLPNDSSNSTSATDTRKKKKIKEKKGKEEGPFCCHLLPLLSTHS